MSQQQQLLPSSSLESASSSLGDSSADQEPSAPSLSSSDQDKVAPAPAGLDPKDLLRVLVASDLHIGFQEKDPIRKDDSFHAFEEILSIARQEDVDFILFAGDLFHENKPSRTTYHRVLQLLRQYTLGDGDISFDIVSDRKKIFHSNFQGLNYEDPNYNIKIPVFTIHGNHDDPSGEGQLSALDLLSDANLINYFGRAENLDDIKINPILIVKGDTKVALYGLGNIRDERLNRSFQQNKVQFFRPEDDHDSWFNLMAIHQNRASHSPKSSIHESMLPSWMDVIIWGHEHECKIVPEPSANSDFCIIQPGSPIATSLCEGEAKQKCVGILEICGESWRLKPKVLKTARPMLRKDVNLLEMDTNDPTEDQIKDFLVNIVDELIAENNNFSSSLSSSSLPLVRVRVEHPESIRSPCPPASRFGQQFVGRVANPDDILLVQKRKAVKPRPFREYNDDLMDDYQQADGNQATRQLQNGHEERGEDDDQVTNVSTLSLQIRRLMSEKERPNVFSFHRFENALKSFVEKEEKNSFSEMIKRCKTDTIQLLEEKLTLETIENGPIIENILATNLRSQQQQQSSSSLEMNNTSSSSSSSSSSSLVKVKKEPTAGVSIKKESIIVIEPTSPEPVGSKRKNTPSTKSPPPRKKACITALNTDDDEGSEQQQPISRGRWGTRK